MMMMMIIIIIIIIISLPIMVDLQLNFPTVHFVDIDYTEIATR
jgi:hypothetical protein